MDTNNMNDWLHDYTEWWSATMKEMTAKGEKMDIEAKMKYDKEMEGLVNESQAENVKDWTKADWEQFKARVSKWWNELEMKVDETV